MGIINSYHCPECDFEWEGEERENKCPQCGAEGELVRDTESKFKEKIAEVDETESEAEIDAEMEIETPAADVELPVQETLEKIGQADRRTTIRPPDIREEIETLYSEGNAKIKKYIEDFFVDFCVECENEERLAAHITDTGKIELIKGDRERSIPWHRLTYDEQKEIYDEFSYLLAEIEKIKR